MSHVLSKVSGGTGLYRVLPGFYRVFTEFFFGNATQPLDERELRMAQLRHRVKKNDADACTAAFLDAIGDSAPSTASVSTAVRCIRFFTGFY